jgi:hypothetical protein
MPRCGRTTIVDQGAFIHVQHMARMIGSARVMGYHNDRFLLLLI